MAREYIEESDFLNDGRKKLNRTIDKAYDAEAYAEDANNKSDRIRNQLDTLAIHDFVDRQGNIFNGIYISAHLTGDSNSPGYLRDTNPDAVSAIIPVKPDTTYETIKELSNRFRIATFENTPVVNMPILRMIKDARTSDESTDTYFTFTTNPNENYVVIYVSDQSYEPGFFIGEHIPSDFTFDEVKISKRVVSTNIVRGKNLLRGDPITGTLSGGEGESTGYITANNGKFEVEKVDPNTTYTFSKSASNRTKLGLGEYLRDANSGVRDILIILEDNSGQTEEYTFTTGENTHYAYFYLAFNADYPAFVQLEKNSERTLWETFGYKISPQAEPRRRRSDSELTLEWLVNVADYGAVGDGVTDDTEAIQNATADAERKTLYFPSGIYKVTGTIAFETGTVVSAYGAKIILGDNFNLFTQSWRGNNMGASIVTNKLGAKRIIIKGLEIEGNKNQLLNVRLAGLLFIEAEDCKAIDVKADWINIKENLTERNWGYNLLTLRAKRIVFENCSADFGGYETFGIYDDCKDITINGGFSGVGWRTSFQIHRGCKNIRVNGLIIDQNHPIAHSSLTLHGSPDKPITDVVFTGISLKSVTDESMQRRGGIQSVEGNEHDIVFMGCQFDSNNQAFSTSSDFPVFVNGWRVIGCKFKGKGGFRFLANQSIFKDNIIDIENPVIGEGDSYMFKDNIMVNNKTINLSGTNYVEEGNI